MENQTITPQAIPQPTEPITPPVQPIVAPIEPAAPKKSPLILVLSVLLVFSISTTVYLYLQSHPKSPAPIMASPSPSPIPTNSISPESSLPEGWAYQLTETCGITIPTPPKTVDVGNRTWTVESGTDQPFGLWEGYNERIIHRNPEEASGFISGLVSVSCGQKSSSQTVDNLLSELKQHLLAEKVKNNDTDFIVQIASTVDVQKWGLSVKELTFSGGMYDSSQKSYLLSKDNYWYLITSKSDSESPVIQAQTTQILDLLKFE